MDQEWTWTGSGSGPELDNIIEDKLEYMFYLYIEMIWLKCIFILKTISEYYLQQKRFIEIELKKGL